MSSLAVSPSRTDMPAASENPSSAGDGPAASLATADNPQHLPTAISDEKSPGVRRAEALASVLTRRDRVLIFFGVFTTAGAFGLDGILRFTYQTHATASFYQHSLLATVNVLRSVFAAAAQPTSARLADIFGRAELFIVAVSFYILGAIVEAVSRDVETFAAGALIYQIGYTMSILLVEVVIADITSTRARLLYSYIPNAPFLVLALVSGNISQAVLNLGDKWRWGIGMWCIIYPVCALPLIIGLISAGRRAQKHATMAGYTDPIRTLSWIWFLHYLFWHLDALGIILLIAVFALILVPITIAGGFEASWTSSQVLAPLVIGVVCIPLFVGWQFYTPRPLVPPKLIRNRAVWAALGIALLLNWAWQMQNDYLYTVLVVAFDFDIAMATRLSSFYIFFSVLTGIALGFVVYKVRRLKVFIVIGTCLYLLAFGLLIRYRGDTDSRAGIIGAQVVLGIAGGMFPYPTMASLQANVPHEQLAVMTGLFLATYNIGWAFGGAVSGAIWTQVMPDELRSRLGGNASLATSAYNNPLSFALQYPVGTPERQALIESMKYAQFILTVTGICLCILLIAFSFALPNVKLNDSQTLVDDKTALSRTDHNEQEVTSSQPAADSKIP